MSKMDKNMVFTNESKYKEKLLKYTAFSLQEDLGCEGGIKRAAKTILCFIFHYYLKFALIKKNLRQKSHLQRKLMYETISSLYCLMLPYLMLFFPFNKQ